MTGYYLLGNGYRAFNPVLMRFISPDTLSPFGKGGLNSYAYCLGDPINFQDPTGHSLWRNVFNFFSSLFPTKEKASKTFSLSKTSISSGIAESTTIQNTKRLSLKRSHINTTPKRRLSDPGRLPPENQFEFVGFHGSAKKHETSLIWGGVNPSFLGKGIDHIGKGFYATPDLKLATTYAFDAGGMLGGEQIFSVHVKNFSAMTPAIDYVATLHRPVFANEHPIQLVFREHKINAIQLRRFDLSNNYIPASPRPSEAPF